MTTEEARRRIKVIQNGSGMPRDDFSENMKGQVAKDLWWDAEFGYGYGVRLPLGHASRHSN